MGPACYHVLHVLPPMVAHEMNFFVDEGLVDADGWPGYELLPGGIAPFNAEKQALAQCMKEKGASVVMDVKPSSVVYLNRRGADLRIIAGWRNQQPSWVMSRPGIDDLRALRGQTVGLKDFGNVRYYALAAWLQEVGLDPQRDVHYVRGLSDGTAALREGRVDAAFVPPRERRLMLDAGFVKLLDISERYRQGRPDRIIVATQRALDEHPAWIAAFTRGIIRAYWFMRTVPENLPYVRNLERRMRLTSYDPDERAAPLGCGSVEDCEYLPFPIDGVASGFDTYLDEWISLGELEPADAEQLEAALRLDVARTASAELAARPELGDELARVRQVVGRVGF
jgi:hypothetical protein